MVSLSRCQKRRLPGRLWYLFVGCNFFLNQILNYTHHCNGIFSLCLNILFICFENAPGKIFLLKLTSFERTKKYSYETDRYFMLHTYVYSVQHDEKNALLYRIYRTVQIIIIILRYFLNLSFLKNKSEITYSTIDFFSCGLQTSISQ